MKIVARIHKIQESHLLKLLCRIYIILRKSTELVKKKIRDLVLDQVMAADTSLVSLVPKHRAFAFGGNPKPQSVI